MLLSNVVGDKNLRSYLAFKGFRKENQREVGKLDNATTDLQDNRIWFFFCFNIEEWIFRTEIVALDSRGKKIDK